MGCTWDDNKLKPGMWQKINQALNQKKKYQQSKPKKNLTTQNN